MGTPRLTWEAYAVTWSRLHGGFDPRRASPLVRGWLRTAYLIGRALGRLGVRPSAVTGAGLLISAAVPVLAARGPGWPVTAAVFVLLGGLADTVDGAVAVVTRHVTALGHLYDSVADRLGELLWLTAFWIVGAPGFLVVTCGALSWLHEYVRARATTAGMRDIGTVTVGERPTRVSLSAVGLLLAGVAGLVEPDLARGTITVVAAVWALLAGFGLAQLLSVVRRALR